MFKWDEKNVKSTIWNAEIASKEIRPFSAKEILNAPQFHQFEGIISALTKAVSELISLEEERDQRMMNMINSRQAPKEQLELFTEETKEAQ